MNRAQFIAAAAAVYALISSSPGLGQSPEPIFLDFDPGNFDNSTVIDNKWLPLKPGTRLVLDGTTEEDGEKIPRRIEFHVTDLTKTIAGVETVVALINDYADDDLVESEIAFYAQDNDGNVWYLGEYPEEYEDGEFDAAKPWIHGLEDARAGLKMKAAPKVGEDSYFQGWGPAVEWDDYGTVMEVGQEDCVPVDCYKDAVVIWESSLEEEHAFQVKSYAPGVGNFRVGWKGEDANREALELIELVTLDEAALEEIHEEALALEAHAYEVSEVYKKTSPLQE